MYDNLGRVLRTQINLSVGLEADVAKNMNSNTLLILDEGDWYLLD